mgnify:CR=1 FL=1
MKKIGILFGQENTFPQAFIDYINSKIPDEIIAEFVNIDTVIQGEPSDYTVIIDRISHDVPFYRSFLKNTALNGTAVINNPFWWSADEKFFNNALATKIKSAVPKTILLPSKQHPEDTNERSFRNLAYPLDWETIFNYVGFPAFLKPFSGGGWKNVYRVTNKEEFFNAYDQTGRLVMMLQEEIVFTDYFRCYCIDRKQVHIMQYDPSQPQHLRYVKNSLPVEAKLKEKITSDTIALNTALGYDFNSVEFAVRDGIPYAIDFCNPAPDADIYSVGEDNFKWIVEAAGNMAINRIKSYIPGKNNLTWGTFITSFVNNKPLQK